MTPPGPLGVRPYRFEQKYCPNRLCEGELPTSVPFDEYNQMVSSHCTQNAGETNRREEIRLEKE